MGTSGIQSQAQPQVFEATYILQNFLNFSQTFGVPVMAVTLSLRGSSVMSSGLAFQIAGAVIVRTGAKEQKLCISVGFSKNFLAFLGAIGIQQVRSSACAA